jgi:ParB/RepB/Spo0J family partition protein
MNNIHESLLPLAIEIKLLEPLEKNPRKGNLRAIVASYEEFGQIKPIVVRPKGDGLFTVVAGNHQLEAAKQLGWDKIAAVQYDVDDERAIAFAIADNRTMELGYTEPEILNELVVEISDYYPELVDSLGWDEFELAEMEQTSVRQQNQIIQSGSYVPPVIIDKSTYFSEEEKSNNDEDSTSKIVPVFDSSAVSINRTKDGQEIKLNSDFDHSDAAIRGSTTALKSSAAPSAAITVQITFDTTEQQSLWYEFIKSLKLNPIYPGSTTAEKLISFITKHSQ